MFCAGSNTGIADRNMFIRTVRSLHADMATGTFGITYTGMTAQQSHDFVRGLRRAGAPEGVTSTHYIQGALLAVKLVRQ